MDDAKYKELLGRLLTGDPVYVQEKNGSEALVYSLEMSGQDAVGFRARGDNRLITLDAIASVSFTPTQRHDSPFESLLIRASNIPFEEPDVACQYRDGELHQISNPLPFGTVLPEGALVEIGFAKLPPTIEALDGYQIAFYRVSEEHAGLLPFPFYVDAADGTYFWQIFIETKEQLTAFRDAFMPECEIEGIPPARPAEEPAEVEGNH